MGMTIFIRIAETVSYQESNEFKLERETWEAQNKDPEPQQTTTH